MSRNERVRDATLHLSTRDGTLVDINKWNIPFNPNTLHGKNIATLYPTHAMVPNVFPNTRPPFSTFTIQDVTAAGPVVDITIPTAFYSGGELATQINVQLTAAGFPAVTFSFNAVTSIQNRFEILNASVTQTYEIDMADTLDRLVAPPADGTVGAFQIPPLTTIILAEPNLAGERMVHITSTKLGHAQTLHSAKSGTQDLCVSVPFHNTVYGGVQHWDPADALTSKLDMAFDISLSNGLDLALWDSQMQPLALPSNFEIELQFKIVHSMNTV